MKTSDIKSPTKNIQGMVDTHSRQVIDILESLSDMKDVTKLSPGQKASYAKILSTSVLIEKKLKENLSDEEKMLSDELWKTLASKGESWIQAHKTTIEQSIATFHPKMELQELKDRYEQYEDYLTIDPKQ